MRTGIGILFLTLVGGSLATAPDCPAPTDGDFTLRDFRIASGETLPEVRIHYRTQGTPKRYEQRVVRNVVLILHGTVGEGGSYRPDDPPAELQAEAANARWAPDTTTIESDSIWVST